MEEEYRYIKEIWEEEIKENEGIYKVKLALKDVRNITGYTSKKKIFASFG